MAYKRKGYAMLKKIIIFSVLSILFVNNTLAADMGIELHKAELSLRYGFKYIQDKDLFIDK